MRLGQAPYIEFGTGQTNALVNADGADEIMGPPLPPGWAAGPNTPTGPRMEPLTIDITGGREMSWWEANQGWILPLGFIGLFILANR